MPEQLRDSDWKLLRSLEPLALDRFCRKALRDIASLAGADEPGAHERYLEVCALVRRRTKEFSRTFDDMRRSTGLLKIALMRAHGLLEDGEFRRFSAETRKAVDAVVSGGR